MTLKITAPTCFGCIHALIDSGSSPTREDPGEAPSAECGLQMTEEYEAELHNREGDPAPFCRDFTAVEIERCPQCSRLMEAAAWSWQIHSQSILGPVAVCSIACQTAMDAKLRAEEEQDTEFDREAIGIKFGEVAIARFGCPISTPDQHS